MLAAVDQFDGLKLVPEHGAELARISAMVKQAAIDQLAVAHPLYPGIGITSSLLSGPSDNSDADLKNVVTMTTGVSSWDNLGTWTGAIDRCPCGTGTGTGTGTCAKMAVLHAKGELPLGQDFRHEGILGNIYTGQLVEIAQIGDQAAVVPAIRGKSWITGINTLVLEPDDPFAEGFTVGDIWA